MRENPRLRARFLLDRDGRPRFVDQAGNRHYAIEIALEDAPESAQSATFRLHRSFWNPVREVFRGNTAALALNITSYGDFDVHVSYQDPQRGIVEIGAPLIRLLEQSDALKGDGNAIKEALKSIRNN